MATASVTSHTQRSHKLVNSHQLTNTSSVIHAAAASASATSSDSDATGSSARPRQRAPGSTSDSATMTAAISRRLLPIPSARSGR